MLPIDKPDAPLQPTLGRKNGVEYSVDERAGQLYAITNDNAVNSKLLTVDVKTKAVRVGGVKVERRRGFVPCSAVALTVGCFPMLSQTKELLPHRENVKLEDLTLYKNHLAVTERYDGVSHVRVFHFKVPWRALPPSG